MRRIVVVLLLGLAAALATGATGQDQGGQDVLVRALARYSETEMRNLEREQRNLFYGQDDELPSMEMHWRSLVDFENGRLLSEDYASSRVTKRTSYVGGTALVLDVATGRVSELSEAEHGFEGILASDPTWPARRLPVAIYEGRVRYGDLVEGEQFALPGNRDKYLFSSSGRLIARVMPSEGAANASFLDIKLYEDERRVGSYWFPFLIKGYHLEGEQATLVQEVRVLKIKVNQPLRSADFRLD